jgi:hypothetical protein
MERDLNVAIERDGRVENAAEVDECHRSLLCAYRPIPPPPKWSPDRQTDTKIREKCKLNNQWSYNSLGSDLKF